MDMDWPKDRMHIYILDDGYFRKPTGPYKEKVDVPDFDSLSELDKQRVLWWDDPYVSGLTWLCARGVDPFPRAYCSITRLRTTVWYGLMNRSAHRVPGVGKPWYP
jgi:hypothetical protein